MRRRLALVFLLCQVGVMAATASHAGAPAVPLPRTERVTTCSWNRPGHNPFMGDVVAAVDRYTDIPSAVRARLKQRMQARQYDDFVDIRRDGISGRRAYEPTIRDMHFGLGQVCREVTRERWSAQTRERGVVYCEQEHCILVPTVCRNVSRINRRPALVAGEGGREAAQPAPTSSTSVIGPTQTSSEPSTPSGVSALARGQGITSSFAEAVAGATLPLQSPGGDQANAPSDTGGVGPREIAGGPTIRWSTPVFFAAPPVSVIPEPATWACLALGLAIVSGVSARRGRRV